MIQTPVRPIAPENDGTWWDEEQGHWRDGHGRRLRGLPPPALLEARQPSLDGIGPVASLPVTRVVLASCHLGHDPGRNGPRDLAALCQRCHMLHDASERRRTRWRKAFGRRAAGDLLGAQVDVYWRRLGRAKIRPVDPSDPARR